MAETTHVWKLIEQWLDQLPFAPSQSRLATSLGLSRSAVTDWKFGKSRPTPDNLHALAEQMRSVMGPDIYERLLEAVNRDQGYLPPAGGASKRLRDARNRAVHGLEPKRTESRETDAEASREIRNQSVHGTPPRQPSSETSDDDMKRTDADEAPRDQLHEVTSRQPLGPAVGPALGTPSPRGPQG